MKNSKKSLVASGLSLAVSCALLLGATFAWFTDSVTSTGNKIQAGNLDVALEEWNGTAYEDVGSDPIFDYDKWEPGYSDIAAVRIANNGSLALKYQLDIVAESQVSALANVIDVYYYQGGDAANGLPDNFGALDSNYERVGTLADVLARENGAANGHLEAGEAGAATYDYAIIVLHMQEEAGNEYKNMSIGTTFDIVLKATQYTSEEDGFGSDQYDAGAAYPVTTAAEFTEALANAQPGDTIVMAEDMVVDEPVTIDKAITIEGNGANFVTSVADKVAIDIPNGVSGVVIKGCDISGSTFAGTASERPLGIAIRPGAGDVTIEDCTFTGAAAQLGHSIWIDGGNTGAVVIKNCTMPRPINLSGYNNTVKDVTIEKNTFTNGFGVTAITLSGSLENVAIRNNTYNQGAGWGDPYGLIRVHQDGLNNFSFVDVVLENNTTDATSGEMVLVDDAVQSLYDAALASGGIVIR